MAQTPAERRKAQRETAKKLRGGQSPLGGEFRKYSERALNPVQAGSTSPPVDYEEIAAREFGRQEGVDEAIPYTYRPTKTTWPGNGWKHRRTTAAGYDRTTQTLRVQFFTNGAQYDYLDVPPSVARSFRRTPSPGKFINRVLNKYEYHRVD